jgi:DNA-binding GntR family transcriptional regulator
VSVTGSLSGGRDSPWGREGTIHTRMVAPFTGGWCLYTGHHEPGRSHVARPKSSDAVYLKIAAALRDRIRRGELKPGDKLPSEAGISAEFGVARGTAREALKRLEDDGLVDTLPAVGRIVRSEEQADKTPRYRRIAAELMAAIEAGDYPPGSQLPGESQLADKFQASRNTIRSALSDLDGRGLIEVVHGKGRIVRLPRDEA